MTPQDIAQRCAFEMWQKDAASQWLGMCLETVKPGYAELSLKVESHHCNGHGICHGGISFALADSCFAFACNSYNQRHVGQHNMVSYLRPIQLGDQILAIANEIHNGRSSGIYDVKIVNQINQICIEMRGFSRRIEGTLF